MESNNPTIAVELIEAEMEMLQDMWQRAHQDLVSLPAGPSASLDEIGAIASSAKSRLDNISQALIKLKAQNLHNHPLQKMIDEGKIWDIFNCQPNTNDSGDNTGDTEHDRHGF